MRGYSLVSATALAAIVMAGTLAWPGVSVAQPTGAGPLSRMCSSDIQKFCRGLRHARAEVRSCLEDNRYRVSPACRRALDTTGGGWRWRARSPCEMNRRLRRIAAARPGSRGPSQMASSG